MATETDAESESVIYRWPPGKQLLSRLQLLDGKSGPTGMMIVSVSVLPISGVDNAFWNDYGRAMSEFRERHDAEIYELSHAERGLLVKMDDRNQVGLMSDMKVIMLRLVQQYFPDNFGMVDQSRLVRIIDLRFNKDAAIRLMEKLESRAGQAGEKTDNLRRLNEEDITAVSRHCKKIGHQAFTDTFVRNQKIVLANPGKPMMEVMPEYFIGFNDLREHIFTDVELRGSGNLFNQLTLTLDNLLLDAFPVLNPSRAKCSINLNVESVFSVAFMNLVKDAGAEFFSRVVFEFRQANILQNFDEFVVASDLIRSKSGTVCVDSIFPETVGVVNLSRLNADIAKIFWRGGAETVLPQYADDIKEIQKSGTLLVLARLDDQAGMELGHELGINMFQGFYVDDMLKDQESD